MVTLSDYTGLKPTWCPGCGNFGILTALNKAMVELEIQPHQVLLVSGIGQAGKLPHYTRGNVFNSLHGRPLPPAIGSKIANPELTVIAISGDGDGYGEGGNHFIHTARRNHNITYLVHNNQVYGLTKGQASPTSDAGFVTKTTPYGAANPVNPVALAIVSGASFVGRGFAGDSDHLSRLIKQGIAHKGFSLIDILQPCVSFNHKNTFQWYRERVYKLEDESSYNAGDKKAALEKALEWGDKIPIGVIYRQELPVYEDQLPVLRKGPLVTQEINPKGIESLLAEFM
jgi:2-oxoglutarate/2-oxoacid ferredoxin oxidoreductase subunit beta